jgi:hypothetical protein
MLEQLEKGDEVEVQEEQVYSPDAVANYRIAILILSAVAAVLLIIVILLAL